MTAIYLPGQLTLNDLCPEHHAELAQRYADAPLKPTAPQQPCDHGLFSDEADQIDLIEMLMDPHE